MWYQLLFGQEVEDVEMGKDINAYTEIIKRSPISRIA